MIDRAGDAPPISTRSTRSSATRSPTPWPRATFEAELARDVARLDVARAAGRVVGFCNYWLVADRRASGEVHILAIATHPDRRRAGHRRARCSTTRSRRPRARAAASRRSRSAAATRPAIALYERAGFRTVHVRARYYQDNGEDALVMLS